MYEIIHSKTGVSLVGKDKDGEFRISLREIKPKRITITLAIPPKIQSEPDSILGEVTLTKEGLIKLRDTINLLISTF